MQRTENTMHAVAHIHTFTSKCWMGERTQQQTQSEKSPANCSWCCSCAVCNREAETDKHFFCGTNDNLFVTKFYMPSLSTGCTFYFFLVARELGGRNSSFGADMPTLYLSFTSFYVAWAWSGLWTLYRLSAIAFFFKVKHENTIDFNCLWWIMFLINKSVTEYGLVQKRIESTSLKWD